MKGRTIADVAAQDTELLYGKVLELQAELERQRIENELLKALLGDENERSV